MKEHIEKLKTHRNVLYILVLILVVLQVFSFVSISSQTSRIIAQQEDIEKRVNDKIEGQNNEVRQELRFNIDELTKAITKQTSDFQQKIDLLKSTQSDFSSVAQESVKKVVSISTDKAAGSGFIVNSAGYVVTNWHVIDQATSIRIITYQGDIIDAQLIGSDQFADLALLKVPGVYDFIGLANSEDVDVGEKVIAIGNPLGLSFSVTEGIVSAVHRQGPNGLEAYIQTDVTLNPGNSGGPLIDKDGKVIGVNNFKIGGAESLGFAIESDVVRAKINEMANKTIIN